MLREINKITDNYIPFAFHFGINCPYASDKDNLAKECFRVVLYKRDQTPDTGFVMNIDLINSVWLHTASTGTSTMDISCSCNLAFDQEIPFPLNTQCNICVDMDIIKIFRDLLVFTDYNKYNIDPTILWDNINVSDGLSYRFYDIDVLNISINYQYEDHIKYALCSINDTPPYRIKSAGITVNSLETAPITVTPVIPSKLTHIGFIFNTTMHLMSDIFSIKNLDLLKKNLKTTYIISPSKYNKINLGGEFDMLRDVSKPKREYIRFACDIGSSSKYNIQKTGCIRMYCDDPTAQMYTSVNDFYLHISVLNKNTVSILGYINTTFDGTVYVNSLAEDTICMYVDVTKVLENKSIFLYNKKIADDDFNIYAFKNMENRARIYGTGNYLVYTGQPNTDINTHIATPCESARVNVGNTETFMIKVHNPLFWVYCNVNKTINTAVVSRISAYFNFNIQYYNNIFDPTSTYELKKNFKVYYLNNIKHLQNYYIN